jgi:SAM-dependent methyltransferase
MLVGQFTREKALAALPKPWQEQLGEFIGETNLNIGCAKNQLPGWHNLDMNPKVAPDIMCNLEETPLYAWNHEEAWFIKDNTYDCILASHVLEHIRNFVPLMADLHRILKPGGALIVISPYASSFDAFEDPHHVRFFTERSFLMLDKSVWETPGHAGSGATQGHEFKSWTFPRVSLVPYPEVLAELKDNGGTPDDLHHLARHQWNIIKELQVIMRAVKE